MFEGKDFLISSFEKGLRVSAISWVFKVLVKCGNPLFRGVSHLNRKGVGRFEFFCELFAVVRLFRRATVDSIVTFRFRRLRRRLVILGYLGFALVA